MVEFILAKLKVAVQLFPLKHLPTIILKNSTGNFFSCFNPVKPGGGSFLTAVRKIFNNSKTVNATNTKLDKF